MTPSAISPAPAPAAAPARTPDAVIVTSYDAAALETHAHRLKRHFGCVSIERNASRYTLATPGLLILATPSLEFVDRSLPLRRFTLEEAFRDMAQSDDPIEGLRAGYQEFAELENQLRQAQDELDRLTRGRVDALDAAAAGDADSSEVTKIDAELAVIGRRIDVRKKALVGIPELMLMKAGLAVSDCKVRIQPAFDALGEAARALMGAAMELGEVTLPEAIEAVAKTAERTGLGALQSAMNATVMTGAGRASSRLWNQLEIAKSTLDGRPGTSAALGKLVALLDSILADAEATAPLVERTTVAAKRLKIDLLPG